MMPIIIRHETSQGTSGAILAYSVQEASNLLRALCARRCEAKAYDRAGARIGSAAHHSDGRWSWFLDVPEQGVTS